MQRRGRGTPLLIQKGPLPAARRAGWIRDASTPPLTLAQRRSHNAAEGTTPQRTFGGDARMQIRRTAAAPVSPTFGTGTHMIACKSRGSFAR